LNEIDPLIKANLEKWSMERLATVDRNLLRLSVFELKFAHDEVPENVVLDEAIEIAKLYGDDQSSKFINGVLQKVKQDLYF
jgi:N utilization substance protein B